MRHIRSANLQPGDEIVTVRVYERPVARFAEGGLARAAQAVRGGGRWGDEVLIHINPEEYQQLQEIWGEPTYNPHTGLPEYGLLSKLKKAAKNIGKSIKKSAMSWTINKKDLDDIKHGRGIAGVGTPLHGLSAGVAAHKALSPTYHIADRVKNLKKNGLSMDTLKRDVKHLNHYWQDAVKENAVPLAIVASGGLGAAGAAPGAGSGAGAATGASTGLGSAGGALNAAANVVPAGMEVVTVSAPALSGGISAGQAVGALGAAGQVAHAADAYQNPNEVQDYNQSRDPNQPWTENWADPQNPTAGELGIQEPALNYQDPSYWDRIMAYGSDMSNWPTIGQGVGAVGALVGGSGSGGDQHPGMPSEFIPGTNVIAPGDPRGRRRTGDVSDYYSYGGGPEYEFYEEIPRPVGAAMGGGINFGYGNGGGALSRLVRGPGTGRSDDIPARLSDGEYVFDAETVALLGDGSTDEGARRLDALRQKLRKHKGKMLSQGKFSSAAKEPEDYL